MISLVETSPSGQRPVVAPSSDVASAAAGRLRESPYPTLRNISCQFVNGVLTLRGTVPTFYLKQIAQTVVLNLPQVSRVDNRIEVTL